MTDETYKPDPRQMEIDWGRGKRQNWLAKLVLPSFDYVDDKGKERHVSRTRTMCDLLKTLERYARDLNRDDNTSKCFLKVETVATDMKVNERTVRRTVKDCVGRGLLIFRPNLYKHAASEYVIVWSEVAQAILDHPDTTHLIPNPDGQQRVQTAVQKPQFTPDNLSATSDNLSFTPGNLSRTPGNLSTGNDGHTTTRVRAVLNHELNHERKPVVKPCSSLAADNHDSRVSAGLTPYALGETPSGGWPHPIELIHLQNRESKQRLWEHAVKFRYVLPDKAGDLRKRFFALANYAFRMSMLPPTDHRWIREPGAFFTSRVAQKKWVFEEQDLRAAVNAISIIDHERARRNEQ